MVFIQYWSFIQCNKERKRNGSKLKWNGRDKTPFIPFIIYLEIEQNLKKKNKPP
jgi:hypothetical protein